jgi:flagellar biogenesis protein FliO
MIAPFGLLTPLSAGAVGEAIDPVAVDLAAEAVRIAGFLAVFLALAMLAMRLSKRFNMRIGPDIQLLSGRNLIPGAGVRVIRVGARAWLIGVTKERVSLLAELSPMDLEAAVPVPEAVVPAPTQSRVATTAPVVSVPPPMPPRVAAQTGGAAASPAPPEEHAL